MFRDALGIRAIQAPTSVVKLTPEFFDLQQRKVPGSTADNENSPDDLNLRIRGQTKKSVPIKTHSHALVGHEKPLGPLDEHPRLVRRLLAELARLTRWA